MVKVTRPVSVTMPAHGVVLAESVHAPTFRMSLRADPFHKIVYVLRGRVVYRDRHAARDTTAGPGTLFAVSRGVVHQLRDEAPAALLLLCLSPAFIDADPHRRALWRSLLEPRAWHMPAGSRRFENLWRRALVEQTSGQAGGVVALHALAAEILVTLARLRPGRAGGDTAVRRVQRVLQEMRETFFDDWSLDRAATRAGLSRRRFSELFRHEADATFLDALTALRLQHAATLLRHGAHSVTGVAFSCGYHDLSHFYRAFRRHYGCTPGTFPGAPRPAG